MEIKKTLFDPLIIVIAVAVIFAIGVDIYVFCNIKKQPTPKPYYASSNKVTYSTKKASTTAKVNPNDVTEAEYEAKKNASSSDIATDTSVTSGWKTYSAKANNKQIYTIKYPANWQAYGDWTLYVKKSSHPTTDTGSYQVIVNPYTYDDNDATFTKYYGPGKLVHIGNYSAKNGTSNDNGYYTDDYLISVGDSKYLGSIFFNTPNDTVGQQILSTLQIN